MSPSNDECTITHFSHTHPLHLFYFDQFTCDCCALSASGDAYSCNTCDYVLHISCAQLPQLTTHPVDSLHTLRLLSVPAYKSGTFVCDACDCRGTGFNYNCASCGIDLHVLCASLPPSMHLHAAHQHTLSLVFGPPDNKTFICDLCNQKCGKCWRYRCNTCGFDAHLRCASAEAARTLAQQHQEVQSSAAAAVGAVGVDGDRGLHGDPAIGVTQVANLEGSGSGHGGRQLAKGATAKTKRTIKGATQKMGLSLLKSTVRNGLKGTVGGNNNGGGGDGGAGGNVGGDGDVGDGSGIDIGDIVGFFFS